MKNFKKQKPVTYYKQFNRNNKLNKRGEGLITIKCYQDGKRKFVSTGISVLPKYWSKKRKRINPSHPESDIFNEQIDEQLRAMRKYELEMRRIHGSFNVEQIGNYVNCSGGECFSDFYKEQLEENSTIVDGTKRGRRVVLKKLLAYNKNQKVYFHQLTYRFIVGFDNFLFSQGLMTSTVESKHKMVNNYINLATKCDLMKIDDNPYKKFTPKTAQIERRFLLPEELERLERLTFDEKNKHLDGIRDMFLFSCYTGLRYSDVSRIARTNIEETKKGLLLKYTAKKTKKTSTLPLFALYRVKDKKHSKPEQLIYKKLMERKVAYKTNAFDEMPFFDYTNQYVNRQLKKIAVLANIKKRLTSHVARHTFGTLGASKMPHVLLQQIMQHSSQRETAIYIQNNPLLMERDLEKIDW